MVAWVTVRCEACGEEREAHTGQVVYHARCPKKTLRAEPPKYVMVRK